LKIPVKTAGKWDEGGGRDYRGETPVKCWENIFNNLDEVKEKLTSANRNRENHQKNFNIFSHEHEKEKRVVKLWELNKFYPLPLSCTKTCDDQFDKESQQTFGQKLALFVSECTLSICTPSPYS
jgi:hypothetical protein